MKAVSVNVPGGHRPERKIESPEIFWEVLRNAAAVIAVLKFIRDITQWVQNPENRSRTLPYLKLAAGIVIPIAISRGGGELIMYSASTDSVLVDALAKAFGTLAFLFFPFFSFVWYNDFLTGSQERFSKRQFKRIAIIGGFAITLLAIVDISHLYFEFGTHSPIKGFVMLHTIIMMTAGVIGTWSITHWIYD